MIWCGTGNCNRGIERGKEVLYMLNKFDGVEEIKYYSWLGFCFTRFCTMYMQIADALAKSIYILYT